MSTLQISPSVLQWAANQSGQSVDALIDLLDCPSKRDKIKAGQLTVSQIEKLAKASKVPFGYFFLDTPPQITRPSIPDLRQISNPLPLSDNFFDTLNDILRKQQWYLDYLKEHNVNKLGFVGKFNQSNSIEDIACDIRNTLKLTIEEQKQCKNFEDFFNLFVERIENIGILVFRNSIVKSNTNRRLSVDEFRGFAIADSYAPIIFINGSDSNTAWIFTLAHELAHIWLGESGVSDIPIQQENNEKNLEKFCNQVAAELLVPKKLFLNAWDTLLDPKIEALSKEFKVSTWVIARRAYDFNKITWNYYLSITESSRKIKQKEAGQPSPYLIYPIRNSKRLTRIIVNTAMSGNMMLREAASLLNIKPDTIVEMDKRWSKQ